jgi:hypothetical protein
VGRQPKMPIVTSIVYGPRKVHFFEFSKNAYIDYYKPSVIPTVLLGLVG